MNKLQYICMSLPFGLMVSVKGSVKLVVGVEKRYDGKWYITTEFGESYAVEGVKPVLKTITLPDVNASTEHILKNHLDRYGMIRSGDAIDIDELAINPYKA